jgi:hypothetical protein
MPSRNGTFEYLIVTSFSDGVEIPNTKPRVKLMGKAKGPKNPAKTAMKIEQTPTRNPKREPVEA